MLQVRTARLRIRRGFVSQFPAKNFNSISLWGWEVCSARATHALLCKVSDSEGKVGGGHKTKYYSDPTGPQHTRAFSRGQHQSGESQGQGLKHQGGLHGPPMPGHCRANVCMGKAPSASLAPANIDLLSGD